MGAVRLALFSDAVFAISATIKVLPIKIQFPVDDLQDELLDNKFATIMFFASFLIIRVIWENHVLLFDRMKTYDEIMVWLNLMLMMLVTFVPYPLTIMGDFETDPDGVLACATTFIVIALIQAAMVFYSNRRKTLLNSTFFSRSFTSGEQKRYTHWHDLMITTRICIVPIVFLFAYGLAFVDHRTSFFVVSLMPTLLLPLLRFVEKKIIGLVPVTRFLSDEVAMDRVMAFSDGVYAISMTFLVLDAFDQEDVDVAKFSSTNLSGADAVTIEGAISEHKKYFAYFLNFGYLAITWTVSSTNLQDIKVVDDIMRVILTAQLSLAGLTPFIAAVLTQYRDDRDEVQVAVRLACICYILASLSQLAFWIYGCTVRPHEHMTSRIRDNPILRWHIGVKILYLPVLMSLTVVLTFIWPRSSYDIFMGGMLLSMFTTFLHGVLILDGRLKLGRVDQQREIARLQFDRESDDSDAELLDTDLGFDENRNSMEMTPINSVQSSPKRKFLLPRRKGLKNLRKKKRSVSASSLPRARARTSLGSMDSTKDSVGELDYLASNSLLLEDEVHML